MFILSPYLQITADPLPFNRQYGSGFGPGNSASAQSGVSASLGSSETVAFSGSATGGTAKSPFLPFTITVTWLAFFGFHFRITFGIRPATGSLLRYWYFLPLGVGIQPLRAIGS